MYGALCLVNTCCSSDCQKWLCFLSFDMQSLFLKKLMELRTALTVSTFFSRHEVCSKKHLTFFNHILSLSLSLADWELSVICLWQLWTCYCPHDWFWQNHAPPWGRVYHSCWWLGGREPWRWLPHWLGQPHQVVEGSIARDSLTVHLNHIPLHSKYLHNTSCDYYSN